MKKLNLSKEEKVLGFKPTSGCPNFILVKEMPSDSETISVDSFNEGIFTFALRRPSEENEIYILLDVDDVGIQEWRLFPTHTTSYQNLCGMPFFGRLFWIVSPDKDPTCKEALGETIIGADHALYWWNREGKKIFQLMETDIKGKLKWEQVI